MKRSAGVRTAANPSPGALAAGISADGTVYFATALEVHTQVTDAYRRYRILWPDQFGLARGKYLAADAAKRGTSFSTAVFRQGYDQNLYNVEIVARADGLPDVSASCPLAEARPGWEPETGIVIADLFYGQEPYPIAPRQALKDSVAMWNDRDVRPLVGMAVTGYVMQAGDKGEWVPIETPSSYLYGTGALVDPSGLLYDIMATAEGSDIEIESVSADLDRAQFEISLPVGDPVRTVDNIFLIRELARELAAERDLRITFLPKPIADRAGNSMHVNLAFEDEAGENLFFDAQAPDGLSSLARTSIGGMLRHHEALTAFCAPTVNSYKRLRQGEILGLKPRWGYDHRFATIRVPPSRGADTRLQHRLADGAANPYLVVAALLQSARLGDKSRTNPGKSLNDYRDGEPDDGRTVPSTLLEAVGALQADGELIASMGPRLVDNFCGLKTIEWNSFVDAEPRWADKIDEFSEWEAAHYLPFH